MITVADLSKSCDAPLTLVHSFVALLYRRGPFKAVNLVKWDAVFG
ncbi:MAG: hypothetical protein ACI95S_001192 [Dinoroseobacter sp.]|jgi:hypothetical protein